jgi:hypothetical protein
MAIMPTMPNMYEVYGLRIASELPFPELPLLPDTATGAPLSDVTICFGDVPHVLDGAVINSDAYFVRDNQVLFVVPGVGRFLADSGLELRIAPEPSADEGDLRLFALGSGVGAILHQRGMLPLHASAVAHEGGCIAFVGDSGQGKSTMASLLACRGHEIVSDDVLVMSLSEADPATVLGTPGIPVFKLWPESAARSGFEESQAAFESENHRKYRIAAPAAFTSRALPITRMYALQWLYPRDAEPEIERIGGLAGVTTLRRNIYRNSLLSELGREPAFFDLAQRLLKQAQLYEFRRGMSFDTIEHQLDVIESHIGAR